MLNNLKIFFSTLDNTHKKKTFIIFLLILVSVFFETLSIGLVVPVVTLLIENDLTSKFPIFTNLINILGNPDRMGLLMYMVSFLLIVFFIKNIFLGFLIWKKNSFVYSISNYYSKKLFNIYLKKSYSFHVNKNSSELINNIDKETSLASGGFVYSMIDIVVDSLVFISILTLLTFFEPMFTLIIAITFSFSGITYYYLFRKKILNYGYARRFWNAQKLKSLNETLRNIKFYIIFRKIKKISKDFSKILDEVKNVNIRFVFINALPRLLFELIILLTLCFIIMLFISFESFEIKNLVPSLALLAVASFRIMPSVTKILEKFNQIKYAKSAIEAIYNEFSQNQSNTCDEEEKYADINFKKLELKNVSFKYEKKETIILDKINLKIQSGKIYGFIGPSGSGKSTLLDILMCLHQIDNGQIILNDNLDLYKFKSWWQKSIGYVPQNILLNDDNIKNNIAFGEEENEIKETQLFDSVRNSNLQDFINNLEKGLYTNIGEDGVKLSGGQKQRIGIARALYLNPKILVLDEITSSLDLNTENQIMSDLSKLKNEKTIFIISHRLSTTKFCDEIYEIKNKTIIKI